MNFILCKLFYFAVVNKTSLVCNFTPELLFFTWKRLKTFNSNDFCIPIPSIWFKKVAALVRSGKFNYAKLRNRGSSFSKYKKKKQSLQVKSRIVEQAFIFLVLPFFRNYFLFKNFKNFTEYLTKVFANLFVFYFIKPLS